MAQVGSGVLSNGYFVRVLEGDVDLKGSSTELALRDGSDFRIFVMNNNVHTSQMRLKQGKHYIGTYLLQGRSAYVFERPADRKRRFNYSSRRKDLNSLQLNFMPEKQSTCIKFHITSFAGESERRCMLEMFDFNTYRELRNKLEQSVGLIGPEDIVLKIGFPNPRQHGHRSVEAVMPREPTDSFLYHYHFSEIISENYALAVVHVHSLHVVDTEGRGITFDLTENIPSVKEVLDEVYNSGSFGDPNTIRLLTSGGRNLYLPHWNGLVQASDDPIVTLFKLEELTKSPELVIKVSYDVLLEVQLFHIYLKSITGKSVLLRRVDNFMPVQLLERLIEQQEDIPRQFQRLVHNGVIMQPGLTLADYRVHLGSTVHLVLQLLGRSDMHLDVKVKKVNEVVSVADDLPDALPADSEKNSTKPRVSFVQSCGIPVDPAKETTLNIKIVSRVSDGVDDDEFEDIEPGMVTSPRLSRKKIRLRVDYQEGERLNLSISERDRSYDTSGTESEGHEPGTPRRRVFVKKLSHVMGTQPSERESAGGDDNVIAVIEKRGSRVTGSRLEMLGSTGSTLQSSVKAQSAPAISQMSSPPLTRAEQDRVTTALQIPIGFTKDEGRSLADDSGIGADESFNDRLSQSSQSTQPPGSVSLSSPLRTSRYSAFDELNSTQDSIDTDDVFVSNLDRRDTVVPRLSNESSLNPDDHEARRDELSTEQTSLKQRLNKLKLMYDEEF